MIAVRNLTRRKIRSTLTMLGVAIGIAAVVALVAVARGIRQQFNDFFTAGEAHLVLTRAGAADPFISYLPDTLIDRLIELDSVAAAYPFLFSAKQIPSTPFFFIFGTSRGSPLFSRIHVTEGRELFDPGGPQRAICVGQRIAKYLELAVGDTLTFDGETFEVVGIFESQVPLLDSGGVLPFADAQRVAGLDGKMSQVLVHLTDFDPDTLAARKAEIEAAFPEVKAASPAEFSSAFDEFALLDEAVVVFTVLAVLIGGIGVMNTMLMSVFERTREIGILQAVGWSKGMILRQVLVEGLIVCVVAGPVGIALGVATLKLVSSIGELGWIAGDYGWWVVLLSLGVALGMGLVGATYPALRAVRITPIEALRYE